MGTVVGCGTGVGFGGRRRSITQSLIAQFGGFWADPNYGGAATLAAQPTLVNGGFETGNPPSNWIVSSGASLSRSTTNPYAGAACLNAHTDGTINSGARQGVSVAGNLYLAAGVARGDGTIAPSVLAAGATVDWTGTNSTSWQEFGAVGLSNSGGSLYLITRNTAVGDIGFDNISWSNLSITQITPRFAAAINCLADGDCEDAGTAAWTAAGATPTKVAGARTGGSGALVLRITWATSSYVQQVALVTGRIYRLRGWARGDGTRIPVVLFGGATAWTGTSSNVWQYFDVTATASNGTLSLSVSGVGYTEWDDLLLEDVSTPAGILAQSTAANQPWQPLTTVNGKRVLQFADTDVLLGSLAAPAYRFLHCGSGGTLPRFIVHANRRIASLATSVTVLRTHSVGDKAGLFLWVTTAGAVVLTWYDATGATLQTVTSAAGAVAINTGYAITAWADGANMGVLLNGVAVIAATAMTFTPDMTLPANLQTGPAASGSTDGPDAIVAGYRDAASTLALHREQASQWGIAA